MKILKSAVVMTALVGSMNANAAGTIDLFTAPTGTTTVQDSALGPGSDFFGNPLTTFLESNDADAPGSILGGFRDMEVAFISKTSTASSTAAISMTVDSGVLSIDTDTGVIGKGTLQWDGDDGLASLDTTTGLGGIDFLTLGDGFNFEIISADLTFDFSIGLYDGSGNSVVFDLAANTGAHDGNIAFSFFSNAFSDGVCGAGIVPGFLDDGFDAPNGDHINSVSCGGTPGAFNIQDINAMEVVFNTNGGVVDVDLSIGAITAVPEPSSLALIGLGLMATGFASKRKSKKA